MRNIVHDTHGTPRRPWSCYSLTLVAACVGCLILSAIVTSFMARQVDQKGCSMSYMRPTYFHFPDFDSKHTRLAEKYSLYLYREGLVDEDARVQGVPVVFVPGNAGSYKQVRSLAAEAAYHYRDSIQHVENAEHASKRPVDLFSVDFNEGFAAFHGQTLLDQAEYLNDAISYILALYRAPSRSRRDAHLPYPRSVVLIGHSMGGFIARTIFTLPGYQPDSVNTIITLAAPHARAPVSFDRSLVETYRNVNEFWREALNQTWADSSLLWDTTLISVAGGGLDTIVPSDYATVAYSIPPTHGFTVFTSTIPEVWAGMDHLAITWCDQLRKVIVRALYELIDVDRPSQTKAQDLRMDVFKKHFLTGLEHVFERRHHKGRSNNTIINVEPKFSTSIAIGDRVNLVPAKETAQSALHDYLIPIPAMHSEKPGVLTILTNQNLKSAQPKVFTILLCNELDLLHSQGTNDSETAWNTWNDLGNSMQLRCETTEADVLLLPSSAPANSYPFDNFLAETQNPLFQKSPPASYLQYDLNTLRDYRFVVVRNRSYGDASVWAFAELFSSPYTQVQAHVSPSTLLFRGWDVLLRNRTFVSGIHLPSLRSSLLAYRLRIEHNSDDQGVEKFKPFLRQHIREPFESKFFVNAEEVDVNFHGISPFISIPQTNAKENHGLSFQIWSDPTLDTALKLSLRIDVFGSIGKLWMRYRAATITFPIMILSLVFEKQISSYNQKGRYPSFMEGLELSLRSSIPIVFTLLTLFATLFSDRFALASTAISIREEQHTQAQRATEIPKNDILLGTSDPFFWFMLPSFGLVAVGLCAALNIIVYAITRAMAAVYAWLNKSSLYSRERGISRFSVSNIWQKSIVSSITILLVATVIPYQFMFIALCTVQFFTCVRATNHARETEQYAQAAVDFYNYSNSVFLLLLCLLPVHLPTILVWIHDLSVHWQAKFPSHHNVITIFPVLVLVEILSSGSMVPRLEHPLRNISTCLFALLAFYTAVYGISYAYLLQPIMSVVCVWLVAVHFLKRWPVFHGYNLTTEDSDANITYLDVKKTL